MSQYQQKLDALFSGSAATDDPEMPDFSSSPVRPAEIAADVERGSYAWAEDVFWVYQHLGDRVSQERTGGKNGRYALWQEAKKDVTKFVNQMLPRAMVLLEKARAKEGDSDEVDLIEHKDIKRLEATLRAAIEEARKLGEEANGN